MKVYIETYIENKKYTDKDTININFDEWKENAVRLEMEIFGRYIVKDKTFVYWEIFSNEEQLDIGDLTIGQRVELILLKSYAGSPTSPHKFMIHVKNKNKKIITSLRINVFCTPKITNVEWVKASSGENINQAYLNTNIDLLVEGQGYYGVPLTLKIHEYETGEVIDGPYFMTLDDLKGLQYFYFKEQNNIIRKITSIIYTFKQKKIYPTLWVNNILLFDGKKNDVILELLLDITKNEEEITSLSPIIISVEEYFTQSYEPCKYEKITISHGDYSEVLFDESKPTPSRYPRHEFTFIAGDGKAEESPPVEITLLNVDTKHCQYNEANKKYRVPYRSDKEGNCKDHKNNVFVVDELYGVAKFDPPKSESNFSFVPRYPYNEGSLPAFLLQYMFSPKEEASIIIQTCRYKKKLHFNIYPDALWTVHLKYGETPDYFYKNEEVQLVTGFKESLKKIRPYLNPILALISLKEVVDTILEYLAMEAEEVSLGLHARYNNKTVTKDYTQEYRIATEYIILQMVSLQLAVEVLLAILTLGETAVLKLPKIAKRIGKVAKKTSEYIDKLEELGFTLYYPAIATYLASYYERQSNGKVALVTEIGIKADPLIGIGYEKTLTLKDIYENRQRIRQNTGRVNIKDDTFTKIIEKVDVEANLYIKVDGILSQEYTVKLNELTGKVSVEDRVGNYFMYNEFTVAQKEAISINITVNGDASLKFKKIGRTELKLKGSAKGAISHRCAFGKDEKGIWMQDILELSEVVGTYMMRAKVTAGKVKMVDTNPEETPVPFTAFDGQTFGFEKVYLLKTK